MLSIDMIKAIKAHDEDGIFDKFKEKILRNEDSEYLESLPDLGTPDYKQVISLMRVYLAFDIDIETFKLLALISKFYKNVFEVASTINKYKIPFNIVKLCIMNFEHCYYWVLLNLYGKGFKEEQIKYLKTFEWANEYNPMAVDLLYCLYDYPYIDIDKDELCLFQKFCSSRGQSSGYYFTCSGKVMSENSYNRPFIKAILSAFINGHTPAELEEYVLSYKNSEIGRDEVDNLKETIEALDEYRELNKLCTKSTLKNYDLSSI